MQFKMIILKKMIFIFIFIIKITFSDVKNPSDSKVVNTLFCNQQLMETYGINGQIDTVNDVNFMCPDIIKGSNCCTYPAQIQIYQKYVKEREMKKIEKLYSHFYKEYSKLMFNFKLIELFATNMKPYFKNYKNSNCEKFSKKVFFVKASDRKDIVLENLLKSIEFFKISYQGFYCTLCNAENHLYFSHSKTRMYVRKGFCQRMVSETLNFNIFKELHLIKIIRLYSQFITSCNSRAQFSNKKILPGKISFFKKHKFIDHIEKCRRNIKSQWALFYCKKYCSNFHPNKMSRRLTGNLDKFISLNNYLKKRFRQIKKQEEKFKKEDKLIEAIGNKRILIEGTRTENYFSSSVVKTKNPEFLKNKKSDFDSPLNVFNSNEASVSKLDQSDDNKHTHLSKADAEQNLNHQKERILDAAEYRNSLKKTQMPSPAHIDPSVTGLNELNRYFKTTFAKPITYKFKEDLGIHSSLDYNSPLFSYGAFKVCDLSFYKQVYDTEGLDFWMAGEGVKIDMDTAKTVFARINPETKKEFELEAD